jgi:hypothetical protein
MPVLLSGRQARLLAELCRGAAAYRSNDAMRAPDEVTRACHLQVRAEYLAMAELLETHAMEAHRRTSPPVSASRFRPKKRDQGEW